MVVSLFVLIALLLCCAFFSAAETSLFSLSSMKVKTFQQDTDRHKRLVAALLERPSDLLVTIIILNILINILLQNTVSIIFGDYSGWLVNVCLPIVLTLIFGEIIPKSIGLANNATIAYRVAPVMFFAQKALLPLRKVLVSITDIVSRSLFFFLRKEEEISIPELQHALRTSRQFGVLQEEEAELIRGYLNLQEATVKELMRPREDILFFSVEDPLEKLVSLFVDEECSRIPICHKSLDNVLGILSSGVFFLHRQECGSGADLAPFLQRAFFVPESLSAHALLRKMYKRKEHLALVVDEYGSVSGLIALEDLVEKVTGDIADRRDQKRRYTLSGSDVIIASGKLELTEFEEIFGVTLPNPHSMITLGGWLTAELGDIPKSGAKHLTHEFLFHILAADLKTVRRIYVRRLQTISVKKKKGDKDGA